MNAADIAAKLSRATAAALVKGDWTTAQGTELERHGLIEHVPRHGFRCCNPLGLAVRAILQAKEPTDER